MKIVPFIEAYNSLKALLDGVVSDADITVNTRRDAEAVDITTEILSIYINNEPLFMTIEAITLI